MIDLNSWLAGFAIGLCGKPLPIIKKTPIGYSYNGVVLPELPEWDKETYPYAYILNEDINVNGYVLVLCKTTKTTTTDWRMNFIWASAYKVVDNAWQSISGAFGGVVVWSNTDVYASDNTLYLSASDPIPVYE